LSDLGVFGFKEEPGIVLLSWRCGNHGMWSKTRVSWYGDKLPAW